MTIQHISGRFFISSSNAGNDPSAITDKILRLNFEYRGKAGGILGRDRSVAAHVFVNYAFADAADLGKGLTREASFSQDATKLCHRKFPPFHWTKTFFVIL